MYLAQKTLGEKRQFELNPALLEGRPVAVLKARTVRDHERLYRAGVLGEMGVRRRGGACFF